MLWFVSPAGSSTAPGLAYLSTPQLRAIWLSPVLVLALVISIGSGINMAGQPLFSRLCAWVNEYPSLESPGHAEVSPSRELASACKVPRTVLSSDWQCTELVLPRPCLAGPCYCQSFIYMLARCMILQGVSF